MMMAVLMKLSLNIALTSKRSNGLIMVLPLIMLGRKNNLKKGKNKKTKASTALVVL
jgi:hypothetical protein